MGPRHSSSGTSPRPWTPGGMSPQCASSFHYLSLASALGGDTFPHRPPSNFTGAPAGRMAASFASRPNVCQPPRVIIVRPARLYCGLVYASTVEDICARGCCSFSHAGIGSHIVPIHAKLSLCTKLAPATISAEKMSRQGATRPLNVHVSRGGVGVHGGVCRRPPRALFTLWDVQGALSPPPRCAGTL